MQASARLPCPRREIPGAASPGTRRLRRGPQRRFRQGAACGIAECIAGTVRQGSSATAISALRKKSSLNLKSWPKDAALRSRRPPGSVRPNLRNVVLSILFGFRLLTMQILRKLVRQVLAGSIASRFPASRVAAYSPPCSTPGARDENQFRLARDRPVASGREHDAVGDGLVSAWHGMNVTTIGVMLEWTACSRRTHLISSPV